MKAGTETKLKFKLMQRDLGLPLYAAKGLLVALWQFAADNAPRGDVGRYSNEELAAAIDWPAEDAERLVAALVRRRWLDRCAVRRLLIHDWQDHAEKYVRERARRLARAAGEDEAFHIPVPPPDTTVPDHGTRVPTSAPPPHDHAEVCESDAPPYPRPWPCPMPDIYGPSPEGGGGAGGTAPPSAPVDSSPPSSSSKPAGRVQLDLYGDGPDPQGEGPHRAPSARVDHLPAAQDHHGGPPGLRLADAGAGPASPATADHQHHETRAAGPDELPAEPDERPQTAQIVECGIHPEDFAAAVAEAVAEALEPTTLRRMQRVWPLLNIAQEVRQIGEWMLANPTQVDRPRRAIQGALAAKHDKLRAEQQQALKRRDAVKGRAPAGPPPREGQPTTKAAPPAPGRLPRPGETDRRRAEAGAWPAVLEHLRADVDAESLATWLEPLTCVGFGPTGVWLKAETEFIAGWVARNYVDQIGAAARAVLELPHLAAPPQVFVQALADGLDHGVMDAAEC